MRYGGEVGLGDARLGTQPAASRFTSRVTSPPGTVPSTATSAVTSQVRGPTMSTASRGMPATPGSVSISWRTPSTMTGEADWLVSSSRSRCASRRATVISSRPIAKLATASGTAEPVIWCAATPAVASNTPRMPAVSS